jgi:tetratricopeptide (TPR) repeat protein
MKPRSRNIYEQVEEDEFTENPDLEAADYWVIERRKNRIRNVMWTLLVLLVTGGLIAFSVIYTQEQKGEETLYFGSRFAPGERIVSFRKTVRQDSLLPDFEIVLDDLQDVKTFELPEQGSAPLTPQWLKQATHYIVVAEQAEAAGHYEKALEEYSKALVIFPKLEGINIRRGMLNLQMNNYQEAISCFKQALTESVVDPQVVNNLGSSYMALDQFSRAEKCFIKATKMDPSLASAQLNLATIYMKTGRDQDAMKEFDSYIRSNPNDLKAMQAFAALLMDNGKWKEAVPLLMRVQRAAPEVAPVYFRLGEALSHSTSKDAAIESIRKGVVLVDPKVALGLLASERFDNLRDTEAFQQIVSELSRSSQ